MSQIDINHAVSDQKRRSQALRSEPIGERKERLKRLKRWILDHRELIHAAVFDDMQKPPQEVDLSEIYPVLTEIRHTLRHLTEWSERQFASGGPTFLGTSGWVQSEPKGVCLIISPWNYPFNLAIGPLVSALAAGNTVVLKPSEYTPKTNEVIQKMVGDLFQPDLCRVIEGDARIAENLTSQPFDHIFFTGSPAVGKRIMQAAAKNLTSVTLELGGKSPTIVDETADVRDAAQKIAWGKWLNAGQTCVAPDYLYLHVSKEADFMKRLKDQVEHLYGRDEDYTAIINDQHYQRLGKLLDDAVSHQAAIAFGGEKDEKRRRMYPVAVQHVNEKMALMQEEIFGPILPVMIYEDLDQVIEFINARPKPLALYLFSGSKTNRRRVIRETSAGTMVINDCVLQFAHPDLPFGGVQTSGFGKAHGKAGFMAFSNEKSVLKQRTGYTMAKTVYPPYSKLKNRMIEIMMKYF